MDKPSTKYTKSGRINIAYQVTGEGPVDIVYIPGWVSNIDLMWSNPELVKFFAALTAFARLILFDKRGTGLSDRVVELSSLEDRMDDIRAVLNAVQSKEAVLFGHSEGGSVSCLFAATYPDRVVSLITFGVFARRKRSPDYPWAPSDQDRDDLYKMIESSWGSGEMNLDELAPSKKDDPKFMEWLASYFRSGASPSAALALTKMNTEVDIINILEAIHVPTLLMCRTHDIDVKVEESKFMAAKIPNATFVEFEGNDHLFWAGNLDEVINEIAVFVTGIKPVRPTDRRLATILFTDILNSTSQSLQLGVSKWQSLVNKHNEIITRTVDQFTGTVIKYNGDGFLLTFDGPSTAVNCAIQIFNQVQILDLQMRFGLHIGECLFEEQDISGFAVNIASRLINQAGKGQILVSQTVKTLLLGTGLEFDPHSSLTIEGLGSELPVFVMDLLKEELEDAAVEYQTDSTNNKNTFLEKVLACIEDNLSDEYFSVDVICKQVGVSERQLQRKLKVVSNKTPIQLIRSVRLYRAKEILLQHNEGVSEVAYQTGFSNLSYFTKCFRKEFGISPSEVITSDS